MDKYNIWWKNTDGSLWFGDGNTTSKEYKEATASEITAWESRVIVLQEVTRLQMMEAMIEANLWDSFKALRASNDLVNEYWLATLSVNRTHPMVVGMKTLMNKTDADLDAIFLLASTK